MGRRSWLVFRPPRRPLLLALPLALALALPLAPPAASARVGAGCTVFVDADAAGAGDGARCGSNSSFPCATIATALDRAQARFCTTLSLQPRPPPLAYGCPGVLPADYGLQLLAIESSTPGTPVAVSCGGSGRFLGASWTGAQLRLTDLAFGQGNSSAGPDGALGGGSLLLTCTGTLCSVALERCSFAANSAPEGAGGAIRLVGPVTLTARGTTFEGNTALSGAAVSVHSVVGTAEHVFLTFTNCSFQGNTGTGTGATDGGALTIMPHADSGGHSTLIQASQFHANSGANGGAVLVVCATGSDCPVVNVTVVASTLTRNRASAGMGGGLALMWAGRPPAIASSLFVGGGSTASHNTAASGGGVYLNLGQSAWSVRLVDLALRTNLATDSNGGGLALASNGAATLLAGAAYIVELTNVDVVGNTARFGAGVAYVSSDVRVRDGNSILLDVAGCVIANNTASDSLGSELLVQGPGTYTLRGGTLIEALDSSNTVFIQGPARLSLDDVVIRNNAPGRISTYFVFLEDVLLSAGPGPHHVSSTATGPIFQLTQVYFARPPGSSATLASVLSSGITCGLDESVQASSLAALSINSEISADLGLASYGSIECTRCANDAYRAVSSGECTPCPPGATCNGITVRAPSGRWADQACVASTDLAVELYQCPQGFCTDGQCASGREQDPTNTLCGACAPGFVHVGSTCQECGQSIAARNGLLILFADVLYLGLVLYLVKAKLAGKKKIFIYFLQTLRLVLGPLSLYDGALSYFNLSPTKYICINAPPLSLLVYQLLSPLVFFVLLGLFYLLHKIPRVWCWDARGHSFRQMEADREHEGLRSKVTDLQMQLLADCDGLQADPTGEAGLGGDAPSFHDERRESSLSQDWTPVDKPKSARTPDDLAERFKFYRAASLLLIFSYQSITESVFHILTCQSVGPCGLVLSQYPDISCRSPGYLQLRAAAFVVLALYVIPFPLVLGYALWRLGDRREDVMLKARFGVFYERYNDSVYWWQVQALVRRFAIIAAYTTFYNFVVQRTLIIALLCWLILALHLVYWPSHSRLENWLEAGSLFTLGLIASTQQAYQTSRQSHALQLAVVVLVAGVLFAIVAATVWALWRIHRAGWRKQLSSLWLHASTSMGSR